MKISLSILSTCLWTGKCKMYLIPTLHHLMSRHWRLNSRHIWLKIYFKISNNLKIGQICPRCVKKSPSAPNKLRPGVRGAYFSSFLKHNFNKKKLFSLLRFVLENMKIPKRKLLCPVLIKLWDIASLAKRKTYKNQYSV